MRDIIILMGSIFSGILGGSFLLSAIMATELSNGTKLWYFAIGYTLAYAPGHACAVSMFFNNEKINGKSERDFGSDTE